MEALNQHSHDARQAIEQVIVPGRGHARHGVAPESKLADQRGIGKKRVRGAGISQMRACQRGEFRQCDGRMPLIKLNRINKGGEILLNSDHIVLVEIESRATTVHMRKGQLFSVEETPAAIADAIERLAVARIKNAIVESGLGGKTPI